MLKKIVKHTLNLYKHMKDDDIFSYANELTYKLLLAMFPFLIFLMTLISYFNIDGIGLLINLEKIVPDAIINMIDVFVEEVIMTKNPRLLSTSLLIALYSASSGFNAVIRALNKAYDIKETRSFIIIRLASLVLVIMFAMSIVISMVMLVFGDRIFEMVVLAKLIPQDISFLYGILKYASSLIVLTVVVTIIYKYASASKISFKSVLPGGLFTVAMWFFASSILSVYMNNFSKYSIVYGSIGSLFILLIWLNLISIILLIGGEINAYLYHKEKQ